MQFVGRIDGNHSKLSKSPDTRRKICDVSDIQGTSPTHKGTGPGFSNYLERMRSEKKTELPPIKEERNSSSKRINITNKNRENPYEDKSRRMNIKD